MPIYIWAAGVYLASIISGVADVDAITISMAFLALTRHFARNVGMLFAVIVTAV